MNISVLYIQHFTYFSFVVNAIGMSELGFKLTSINKLIKLNVSFHIKVKCDLACLPQLPLDTLQDSFWQMGLKLIG